MTARHYQSLEQTARAIVGGEISSREVTAALLDRIAALDPRLRSYATVTPERALRRADAADAALAAGTEALNAVAG